MSATTNGISSSNGNGAGGGSGNNSAPLRQTPLTCSGHTRPVTFLAFSGLNDNDGSYYCISGCKDGKPMLRQGATGDWIGTFEGHKGAVWGVDLNGDASQAASGSADFSAIVWDAYKGSQSLNLKHKHIVKSVKFSHDQKNLSTASNDKKIRIWDLKKEENPISVLEGHTSGIKQVLYTRDDSLLISAGDDKTLRIWDAANASEIQKITLDESPGGLELSQDGSVLTVAHGKNITFYDVDNSFKVVKSIAVPSVIYSASLHPKKKIVVCGGEDFLLYKYDYETEEELENFKGHFGPVHCVRFSPDGELYASGSEDGTLRLWQTEVGKTYGLWKCVDSITGADLTKSEAVA